MNLNLFKDLQEKLQSEMQRAQEELARAEVIGESGAGMVKVRMSGHMAVRQISIDPAISGGDRELLEDLVAAAVNDAINKAQGLAKGAMDPSKLGINLPPGFKLPF